MREEDAIAKSLEFLWNWERLAAAMDFEPLQSSAE
jgi:hypothetical protein